MPRKCFVLCVHVCSYRLHHRSFFIHTPALLRATSQIFQWYNFNSIRITMAFDMSQQLKVLNAEYGLQSRSARTAKWALDLTPARSDNALTREVIVPKVVLSGQLESGTYSGLATTRDAVRLAQLEVEDELWHTKKKRYDQFLTIAELTSHDDTVPNMSELVVKNGIYLCLGGAVATPGEFYVNSVQSWNPLEGMMTRLQREVQLMDQANNFGAPWEGHLIPGFIVAARSHKGMEFHRARILEVLGDTNYKVQFLDYGDTVVAPLSEIRYLPMKLLETMEFQGIRCTLQFDVPRPWSTEEGDYFRKLISGKTLAIVFKNVFKIEEGNVWEVDVHIYNEDLGQITDFHVEHQVFRESWRDVPKRGWFQDVTDPKVVLTKFNLD